MNALNDEITNIKGKIGYLEQENEQLKDKIVDLEEKDCSSKAMLSELYEKHLQLVLRDTLTLHLYLLKIYCSILTNKNLWNKTGSFS